MNAPNLPGTGRFFLRNFTRYNTDDLLSLLGELELSHPHHRYELTYFANVAPFRIITLHERKPKTFEAGSFLVGWRYNKPLDFTVLSPECTLTQMEQLVAAATGKTEFTLAAPYIESFWRSLCELFVPSHSEGTKTAADQRLPPSKTVGMRLKWDNKKDAIKANLRLLKQQRSLLAELQALNSQVSGKNLDLMIGVQRVEAAAITHNMSNEFISKMKGATQEIHLALGLIRAEIQEEHKRLTLLVDRTEETT